jgi:hypothetical protein
VTATTTPSSSEQVKLLTAEDFEALCSPDLQQTLRDTASPTLSPNQQLLLALTARSYKRDQDSESTGVIVQVFLSVVCFLFVAVVTFGIYWLLNRLLPDAWFLYTAAIVAL